MAYKEEMINSLSGLSSGSENKKIQVSEEAQQLKYDEQRLS